MNQVAPPPVGQLPNGSSFPIPEDHLTAVLGIPRKILREARSSSAQGTDWEFAGKRIFWSQKAADRFVADLAPDPSPGIPSEPENAPTPPPGGTLPPPTTSSVQVEMEKVQVLKVVAWNFPNRRVIHCVHCVEANGAAGAEAHPPARVAVRVKDSRLFRAGMRVLARPTVGSAWQFEGNPENPSAGPRGPRWPGRW